ncbi:terminase gpP N-terminus-related DNA-binding protein [Paracoccus aestuariivivens]|uniref:Terminase ATPase subunit N-terminal domain-containing protein n=1 Tax=Paracoccus aestuariivivens TaxID=1820333 RepID=A0A6L6JDX2_9RHOB|nr:sigma-70 family RNA polymerase sigma factor [Paracoccus aestuariivivens]MTH79398.1 hypothetical protein [Paracoccus aestuariivivens]
MATFRDPETGVLLNHITVQRSSLGEPERAVARSLYRRGYKQQHIAAMLGTNQGRVNEALDCGGARGNGIVQPSLF